MEFEIKQVGRRWFVVEVLEPIDDHGAYYEIGEVEATYSTGYWDGKRSWTLLGEGSRKYRDAIIDKLENFVEQDLPYKER